MEENMIQNICLYKLKEKRFAGQGEAVQWTYMIWITVMQVVEIMMRQVNWKIVLEERNQHNQASGGINSLANLYRPRKYESDNAGLSPLTLPDIGPDCSVIDGIDSSGDETHFKTVEWLKK